MFNNKCINKSNMSSKGFTLVELMIVVVLIGILSGVVLSVINVGGIRAKSRDSQRAGDLKRIQTALELYFADYRGYPSNSGSWLNLTNAGANVFNTAIKGTYIQAVPQDPRNGENMPAAQCSLSTFGYYYRTDTCVGAGCLAGRYVLLSLMETSSAATMSSCSSLVNCSSGNVSSCNCAGLCYGVENPL